MAAPLRLELPGGIVLEPVPPDPESAFWLDQVSGLDGAELRDSWSADPDRDGEVPGPVRRAARVITAEITIVGRDRADADQRVAALRRAVRPTSATWPLRIHGRTPGPDTLTIDVQPSAPFACVDGGDGWPRRLRKAQIVLKAPDPRLLDAEWQTAVVTPPPIEGGLEFPVEFPVDWGGLAHLGQPVVTAGDDDTWPLLTIRGPITDPILGQITTGQQIVIDGTLSAGQTLEIDPRRRTVLLDGDPSQSRYHWVDRSLTTWWSLAGGHNQIGLLGTGTDTTTRLGLLWRDAWL